MIKKIIVYFICGVALLLPCKSRILYGEIIAWLIEIVYSIFYFTMKKVLKEVSKNEQN